MLKTIRARILATSVAITITALAATGTLIYYVVKEDSGASINESLKSISAGHALAIQEWISAKARMTQALADSVSIGGGSLVEPLKLLAQGGDFQVTTLGLSDRSASTWGTTLAPGYDPTSRPWYKQALAAGRLVVTTPFPDATSGRYAISFAAPIIRSGTLKGVIASGVFLDHISSIVNAIHPTPASFAFLVDHNGRLIATSQPALVMKPAADLSPALTTEGLATLTNASEPLRVKIGGATKLLKAQSIAGSDWHLVLALDEFDVSASMRAVATTTLIAIVIVSLVAAITVGSFTYAAMARILRVRDALVDISSGSGDLTRRLQVTGRDEASQIASAFNSFSETIGRLLLYVRSVSESVNLASNEIAQGNEDLSNRSEHAASSLQETAAAIEEISGSARNSADAAKFVRGLTESASEVATRGGRIVNQVVEVMGEIKQASSEMGGIITVIDGIAFQTNILALNAAVEAARANEHGKGFAVVAGEVRSLAQRSAQAAREIKELIDSSMQKADVGSVLVETAGVTMDRIVEDIRSITNAIAEVSVTAAEQSAGLEQVNKALSQLDNVTQQNAALVEQSAAATSQLSEQATLLAGSVAAFKLPAAI